MNPMNRQELYRSFIEFVRSESQLERSLVNRQMFSVFFWCFLMPAILSLVIIGGVKFGFLPYKVRWFVDWVLLVFPVSYALYFLGSQVLRDLPSAFRQGGASSTLGQALKDGAWRERVCAGMNRSIQADAEGWRWITENFRMDLKSLQFRNSYLTALAGAVFFLIMQGIDWISEEGIPEGWMQTAMKGDFTEWVGLGLFLLLLYLSGSQTYHSLSRYLNCAELITLEHDSRTAKKL